MAESEKVKLLISPGKNKAITAIFIIAIYFIIKPIGTFYYLMFYQV